MNKWILKTTAFTLAATMVAGQIGAVSAEAGSVVTEQELKIAVLSDTHYLSPTLIKDTADFTTHLNSDRKMFAESEAFLNALLDTVKKDNPDVLLISGDLTKDGEKESHEGLAEILEKFEQQTGAEVYITPGNHDLNNSNGVNFNTEDGVAVPAGRTTPEIYKEIYGELVYNDETVIDTFTPAKGKQAGCLSYVARPEEGFTIISIDSARYSADNTESGKDEHETSGQISAELEQWVEDKIAEAKDRGDTVIGLQHHGYIPHFGMEPDLLPMYLVNDYERLTVEFADAGMQYFFTGHMHANDIASLTTEKGNTIYDIETGSVVTYPSPARGVTITRSFDKGVVTEDMDVKTYTGIDAGTFVNPVTGTEQTISDITAYGEAHGFSNDMLNTTVNGFLHGYYDSIAAQGSEVVVTALLNDLLADSLPGDKEYSIKQLLTAMLPLLLDDKPTEGKELQLYFDKGAVQIDWKGENGIQLEITPQGISDSLEVLFAKADELMEDKTILDNCVKNLVEDITAIEVAKDGDKAKTLLDYVNYIYQSHLAVLIVRNSPNGSQTQELRLKAKKSLIHWFKCLLQM